jgi:hypothetical protein
MGVATRNGTDDLTAAETAQLVRCEATIQRGVKTYVEVGNALDTIRKGRLYRETHKTFETYCLTRWKISRCRAYELITAAEVGKGLSANGRQIPANERQARELAKATPAARLRVWEQATADGDGDQLSAAELRDIISRLPPEEQLRQVNAIETRQKRRHIERRERDGRRDRLNQGERLLKRAKDVYAGLGDEAESLLDAIDEVLAIADQIPRESVG